MPEMTFVFEPLIVMTASISHLQDDRADRLRLWTAVVQSDVEAASIGRRVVRGVSPATRTARARGPLRGTLNRDNGGSEPDRNRQPEPRPPQLPAFKAKQHSHVRLRTDLLTARFASFRQKSENWQHPISGLDASPMRMSLHNHLPHLNIQRDDRARLRSRFFLASPAIPCEPLFSPVAVLRPQATAATPRSSPSGMRRPSSDHAPEG